jgi:hypothetical protein
LILVSPDPSVPLDLASAAPLLAERGLLDTGPQTPARYPGVGPPVRPVPLRDPWVRAVIAARASD